MAAIGSRLSADPARLIWFLSMAPPPEGLSVEDARTDVAMRPDYLLKRVVSEEFGVADM